MAAEPEVEMAPVSSTNASKGKGLQIDAKSASNSPAPITEYESYQLSPRKRNLFHWRRNMAVINFVEFSAESSRGIVLPTLFLYCSSLGGDITTMGLLTSLFSVGRFLSSLLFGWMSDRYEFRTVYIFSSFICLFGNFFYLLADVHVTGSLFLLCLSRFITGFGAGNRSVCRANVAALTTVDQRLTYINILATVVFLGYALTPGIGSLVAESDMYLLGVHINKFTAPGAVLMSLNVFTIILLSGFFDESIEREDGPPPSTKEQSKQQKNTGTTEVPERIVFIGALVFIMLNFIARGILSIFETINIPLFLQVTGHKAESTIAVVEASNFQFYLGLLGLVTYFCIEVFRHHISDVAWVVGGFGSMAIGNIILSINPESMSFYRLALGELFVWSIGCPITTAVVVATFSKILGGRPQGTLMGLLGSAGSVSRMVLPLLPAVIPSFSPLFLTNVGLCMISVVCLIAYSTYVSKWKAQAASYRNATERTSLLETDDGPDIHA